MAIKGLEIRRLGERALYLKAEWCFLKDETTGKSWRFFHTIPDGSILVQCDDGAWWMMDAGTITRLMVDEIRTRLSRNPVTE